MVKTKLILSWLFIFLTVSIQSQTQTIRGRISDKQSKHPLVGASVIVLDSYPVSGTITDKNGNFNISDIQIGRNGIKISCIGYESLVIKNLILTSSKEQVLEIFLDEKVNKLKEIKVMASNKKAMNEMATVSARSFTVEQTQKYAGSLMDPARMATNFAGVVAANDERNDIIIRGNSPMGLLWKLEGIPIPNPNHFAENGTTGGAVSILNNNNLSNSDFFTGAFPAEYGNALSGVFDLKLRRGNDSKFEYTLQTGFMGLELGAEGPLGNGNSFITNYRYSTISLLDKLGVTGNDIPSIPRYQDITFKIDFKNNEKSGKFSLFAIGGLSNMDYKFKEENDNDYDVHDENENLNSNMYSDMAVAGLSHFKAINSKNYIKTTFAYSISRNGTNTDTILSSDVVQQIQKRNSNTQNLALNSYYNYKQNAKNNFRLGFLIEHKKYQFYDKILEGNQYFDQLSVEGTCMINQMFAQWQHKFSDKLKINSGINLSYFSFNKERSVEPRLGLKYQIRNNQSFNLGAGLHSQIQALPLLLYNSSSNTGEVIKTNKNLGFTKSIHIIGGYEWFPSNNLKIKIEPYYQHLYNVPIEEKESFYSSLNMGADFEMTFIDSLVNKGIGRNYGLDLSIEKFFGQNYYFLITGSLYESKYTGSDNIERNTVFNGNFAVNVLAGFEKALSKRTAITGDIKLAYIGNRRYIPINIEESISTGVPAYEYHNAYNERYKDYFRFDLKVSLRRNKKKVTQYFILDIMNLLNTQNIYMEIFNPKINKLSSMYQYGIMPNLIFKLEF